MRPRSVSSLRCIATRLALLSVILGATLCAAADITYVVNLPIGSGSITGDIVTDGTLGPLTLANFVDWDLTVSDGTSTPDQLLGPLSGNNSTPTVKQLDQSATSTQLLFNFSATDGGYFFFSNAGGFACFGPGNGVCALGKSGNVEGLNDNGNELSTDVLTGTQAIGTTPSASVPEPSGLTLMIAGVSILGFGCLRKRIVGKASTSV